MSARASLLLVASRELRQAARKKSLRATAALLLIGSTAAMVVPDLIGGDDASTSDVTVVGDDPALTQALEALGPVLDTEIEVRVVAWEDVASRLVENGDTDLAVVAGEDPTIIVRSGEQRTLVGAARQALFTSGLAGRLADAGLDDAQIGETVAVPAAEVRELDPGSQSRRAASAIISIVLYILLLTGMAQVATGTAIEKSNRISEMLLPVVRPSSLLFGKVVGVGVTNIVILTAGLLPIIVEFVGGGSLPDGIGGAIAASAAWFVLGLALYLTLAGMLGALVERQEEAGQVVAPLTFLLIGTYIAVQGSGDSAFSAVLGYVPLTSPIAEPARIAAGTSSPIEIVVSLLLLALAVGVAGVFASRIYARAIVRTGRRLKLRDVLNRPVRGRSA